MIRTDTKPSHLKVASPPGVWDREFSEIQVIPTSTRTSPSKALLLFAEFLRSDHSLVVFDAGAGIGRNAIYLARQGHKVYAADSSRVALQVLKSSVETAQLQELIQLIDVPLEGPLPFPANAFDLLLDSYVSCHFLDDALIQHYWSEMHRVTRKAGLVFSSLFSVEDEYYRELAQEPLVAGSTVVDPRNGIAKQLFTLESARRLYSDFFKVKYLVQFEFDDHVVGRDFRRSVIATLMEK